MRFLLVGINSKFIHSNPAIHSLRSFAGEYRKYVEIGEYTINHEAAQVLGEIYARKPDVIGFSCYIWNWNMVRVLLSELPKVLPGVPLWLGGPEVSFEAEGVLKEYPGVQGIMIGEGEDTFRELLLFYLREAGIGTEGKSRLGEIPGILFRDRDEWRRTEERKLLSFGEIPFFYDQYEDMKPFEHKIIYYESSRGCPFRCSYCLSAIDRKLRLKAIGQVEQELKFFLDKRVKQVKFIDRTFNCSSDHAEGIWGYMGLHDNGVTNFHFEIAADLITEEQLALMAKLRPGLMQLEIGVQSTNKRTLKEINRRMDLVRLKEVVARIRSGRNIHIHLDLIAGLPWEDFSSFRNSFREVYEMRPEQLQLGFLKVLKGSPMYERAKEYGIEYWDSPPYEVLKTRWLSYEEVRELKKVEEMLDMFYNSSQFVHTLRALEKCFESPFDLFHRLAGFYERRGYYIHSPSRAYRYEVLLSFAEEVDGEHLDYYRESLIYDLYLREKVKSRPEYAGDMEEHREFIREFYKKEESAAKYLGNYQGHDSRQMMRMTHLEAFHYAVWEGESGGKKEPVWAGEDVWFVLFDYSERDPLTGNAGTYYLKPAGED